MAEIEDLKQLLGNLKDWEKAKTNIPGIKIIKIPGRETIPERLALEINPVDEAGNPLKKNGSITITNNDLFCRYVNLFENPKIKDLMKNIEDLRKELTKFPLDDSEKALFKL